MMKCKECEHCKMRSRANVKYAGYGTYGRGEFWCEHPDAAKLPLRAFGNSAPKFIGFGTVEKDSKLQMKTSPRWCPLRGKKNE